MNNHRNNLNNLTVTAWVSNRMVGEKWDILSSSEDEDMLYYAFERKKNERLKHIRIEGYVELVALNYSFEDFRSHFRMSPVAVEELCIQIKFKMTVTSGRPAVSRLSAVLLTLWTIATQETYREVSDRFGFSKSTAFNTFIYVCKLICKLKYIKFPIGQELRDETVEGFENLRGVTFPNVVGCVDGSHIEIKAPAMDNSYYNRKGYASVILQAIVNSRYEFVDVFCGWPGSSHDSRVWQNSPIYQKIMEEHILPSQYHLLGDSAYPLHKNLMVPFRDNGHLTREQKKFNRILSSHRVVVEQAFGRLYEVFRRLKFLNILNLSNCKHIIIAACMLHNYIISKNEAYDFDDDDEGTNDDEDDEIAEDRVDRAAKIKRDQIMTSLL